MSGGGGVEKDIGMMALASTVLATGGADAPVVAATTAGDTAATVAGTTAADAATAEATGGSYLGGNALLGSSTAVPSAFTPSLTAVPTATADTSGSFLGSNALLGNAAPTTSTLTGLASPQVAANAAFSQGAGQAVDTAASNINNPSGLAGVWNLMKAHPYLTAGAGLGGYTLYNMLTGRGNNYLRPYQPVSASSMGLGSTMAAGYQPVRVMASGGITSTPAAAGYTPTSYGGVVPTRGVAPADLTAAPQTNNLQSLIASALPSNTPQSTIQSLTSQAQSGLSAYGLASGGITSLPQAQRLTQSNPNMMGSDPYPLSGIASNSYNMPAQSPVSAQQAMANTATNVNPLTGMPIKAMAGGGMAAPAYNPNSELMNQYMMRNMSGMPNMVPTGNAKGGPISGNGNLGSYSDGGQMLQGPGDGMSDSIPATIGGAQPARLAQGEFVVPADVVSHLGNGSTDAGAKQLYAMMDKVRKARTGNPKQGKQINPSKYMPA